MEIHLFNLPNFARVIVLGVLIEVATAAAQVDGQWTVTVNGQAVVVQPDGSFRIPNIAAPDLFGEGGPGTSPDFKSDDFLVVTGVSTAGATTEYVFTEFFQIDQGLTYFIQNLTLTDIPPPLPESIVVSVDKLDRLIDVGETALVAVTGTMADGSVQDLTERQFWTVYRTSNPQVATIGPNGLVTGVGVGTAFITASNGGVASVVRIDVVTATVNTTVEGFVEHPDGSAAAGASVVISRTFNDLTLLSPAALADGSGNFSIPLKDVPVDAEVFVLATSVSSAGFLEARKLVPTLVADGFTDAGLVVLTPAVRDAVGREFTAYNPIDDFTFPDAVSREFTAYNPIEDLTFPDAIAREFTVFVEELPP